MKLSTLIPALLAITCISSAVAEDKVMNMEHHAMHQHMVMDERTSLNLAPQMAQHQLQNMRSHVVAVQTIIGLLASKDFDQAADVAHNQLGLTEEMRKMCTTMSDNKDFNKLGLAFHQSADQLGETLKTKDMKKSLEALHTTMNYCVQCHSTFRQ